MISSVAPTRLSTFYAYLMTKIRNRNLKVATGSVEQALRPVLNFIFYHFNCSEHLLKSHYVFLVPAVAACSQLLLKSVSKHFENVEWSNSLLRHFKIQTLLKINCSMAAISTFGVTQHSPIFSLFFMQLSIFAMTIPPPRTPGDLH